MRSRKTKSAPTNPIWLSKAAPQGAVGGKIEDACNSYAVYFKKPNGRWCLFRRYAMWRLVELIAKQLVDIGCIVSIEVSTNASPHGFDPAARMRNALDHPLLPGKSSSEIAASEVTTELRDKHPDIATECCDFDMTVSPERRRGTLQ